MSELELLFLVLAVIYGWECACWLPRGSVAFLTRHGRHWRPAHPGLLLGNARGGLIFAHPLPPLGTLLVGNQFPLSISAEAVLAFVSSSVNPGWRPEQTGKLFRFKDIRSVEARGRRVLVNGEVLLKTASPGYAEYLAQQLRQLSKLTPVQRPSATEELSSQTFDTKAIERRWDEFQKQSSGVRRLTNGLFVYLFICAPSLISSLGLGRCGLALLIGLLVLSTTIALKFWRIHKYFYPKAEDERFTHFLLVLLSPATTIRACDVLSRPLLEDFHPLAIARVFCPEKQFREFACKILREVRHPGLPVCPTQDPAAQAAERNMGAVLETALNKFVKRTGINPAELTRPPVPAETVCLSFCPRCLAQFTTREGKCADCGGLPLVPFEAEISRKSTATVAP